MRVHHAFDSYVLDLPPHAAESVHALKIESVHVGGLAQRFIDIVLRAGNAYVTLLGVRVVDGALVWHARHRALSAAVLADVERIALDWSASKLGHEAYLDFFARDEALQAVASDEAYASPVFPGLAAYGRLFREAERYASVAPYLFGSRVVDLVPRSGYGAATLRHTVAKMLVEPKTQAHLAERFPQLRLETDLGTTEVDAAVALGVAIGDLEATLERATRRVREDGRIVLSVRGEGADEALRALGCETAKMVRPGGERLGALDETIGVRYRHVPTSVLVETPISARCERALRILMVLRPSAETAFGGDVVQVRETAQALRARGHDVVLTTSPSPDANGFDLVHLSNLTSPTETITQVRALESFPGPIVMMPIFTDHSDEATWGMHATNGLFSSVTDDESLARHLQALRTRTIAISGVPTPPARADIAPDYTALQAEILDRVDFAIANAHSEMHRVFRYLTPDLPYGIAPSCADPRVYGSYRAPAFEAAYGVRDFVLTTGRLEPRKNQLLLFEALRESPYTVVCIGGCVDEGYAHLVRAYRPANVLFLPFLPEEVLAGAYAAARVVVLPSWDEVVSLTSLNAAISEASMVLTRNSYEHEYFLDDAEYCDPASQWSIRAAIDRAWNSHDERTERRRALAQRVRKQYSWERSAEMTEVLYYRVLAHNPRGARRRERFASRTHA